MKSSNFLYKILKPLSKIIKFIVSDRVSSPSCLISLYRSNPTHWWNRFPSMKMKSSSSECLCLRQKIFHLHPRWNRPLEVSDGHVIFDDVVFLSFFTKEILVASTLQSTLFLFFFNPLSFLLNTVVDFALLVCVVFCWYWFSCPNHILPE